MWERALEHLAPAIERSLGRYDEESVLRAILNRDMQLWLAVAEQPIAAAVTRISIWPTGLKTCRVLFAGGKEMKRWTYMMDGIGEWAKSRDCRYLEVEGRPGWERILGWNKESIELVKDLTDG